MVGKTDFAALLAVATNWYTYGAMTVTYTWTDATTTTWTAYVVDFSLAQTSDNIETWDYSISFAVGQERS